jgi:hypothetical protein
MIKKTIKKMKCPFIVTTGHHYSGKSYASKLIKSDLNITVNLNSYDFITRMFMYFFDINPSDSDYN